MAKATKITKADKAEKAYAAFVAAYRREPIAQHFGGVDALYEALRAAAIAHDTDRATIGMLRPLMGRYIGTTHVPASEPIAHLFSVAERKNWPAIERDFRDVYVAELAMIGEVEIRQGPRVCACPPTQRSAA